MSSQTTKTPSAVISHTHPANTFASARRRRSTGRVQRKAGPKRFSLFHTAKGKRKETRLAVNGESESNRIPAAPRTISLTIASVTMPRTTAAISASRRSPRPTIRICSRTTSRPRGTG